MIWVRIPTKGNRVSRPCGVMDNAPRHFMTMHLPSIGHLLWLGAGALGMKIVSWLFDLYTSIFGYAFKEGIAAAIKKGGPLTKEEQAELKKRVAEGISKKLNKEAEQDLDT